MEDTLVRESLELLFREVNELLNNEWDPLGVSALRRADGLALDEYEAIAWTIARELICGSDTASMEKTLADYCSEELSIAPPFQRNKHVAAKLLRIAV